MRKPRSFRRSAADILFCAVLRRAACNGVVQPHKVFRRVADVARKRQPYAARVAVNVGDAAHKDSLFYLHAVIRERKPEKPPDSEGIKAFSCRGRQINAVDLNVDSRVFVVFEVSHDVAFQALSGHAFSGGDRLRNDAPNADGRAVDVVRLWETLTVNPRTELVIGYRDADAFKVSAQSSLATRGCFDRYNVHPPRKAVRIVKFERVAVFLVADHFRHC